MQAHRRRRRLLAGLVVLAALIGLPAGPAAAVNLAHSVVVSADPVNTTPNVLDGQVNAIAQAGGKMIVGGSFTQVRRGGGAIMTHDNIFDNRLLYRGFELESGIVGAEVFVAAATGFGGVRGMTMAGGNIHLANAAGTLSRVAYAGGAPQGAATPISGPGIDGINWASQGLFVLAT